MKREELLDAAKEVVTGEREDTYGGPEDSFGRIALLWNAYFKASGCGCAEVNEVDVALMLDLLKTARLIGADGNHPDSWVDKAGYAACGAEVASTPQKSIE